MRHELIVLLLFEVHQAFELFMDHKLQGTISCPKIEQTPATKVHFQCQMSRRYAQRYFSNY